MADDTSPTEELSDCEICLDPPECTDDLDGPSIVGKSCGTTKVVIAC